MRAPAASSEAVARSMRGNRSVDTQPEQVLRRHLRQLGLGFELQRRVGRYRPDVVFPGLQLAVLVHGCFWHGCPKHYAPPRLNSDYWRGKVTSNIARDLRCRAELEAGGWRVLVVWEHEVLAAPVATSKVVLANVLDLRLDRRRRQRGAA